MQDTRSRSSAHARPEPAAPHRRRGHAERGVTLLVVLVLLCVMVLGGLAVAKLGDVGMLVAGNVSYKDRALHASEAGVNTAYAAVQALGDDNLDVGTWYFARAKNSSAEGLPMDIDWNRAPEIRTGLNEVFSVRYVVDRQCSVALVTDQDRQCLAKQVPDESRKVNMEGTPPLEPPSGKQFRITVRVTGPKDSHTFVQALVNRGST